MFCYSVHIPKLSEHIFSLYTFNIDCWKPDVHAYNHISAMPVVVDADCLQARLHIWYGINIDGEW